MKNTKKFAFLLALVLVCSFFVFSISASAKSGPKSVAAAQAQAGPSDVEYLILCRMVDAANLTISALVRVAQLTPYNDVPWLLASVDVIVTAVFNYANSIGAEVQCEYVEYYIDRQYVLIDPIWVVNPIVPPDPDEKD